MIKHLIPLVLLSFFVDIQEIHSCNEAVCGSVVSKCLLTKSCNCEFNFENTSNVCTCCKDCLNCLGYLYPECCSCVDMCPKPNSTNTPLSKKSHVEDLDTAVPGLFNALTESPDDNGRWNSTTFPMDIDINLYAVKKEIKLHMQSAEQEVIPNKPSVITKNCTVAYWTECMSWTKCKSNCISMGASSYRWFHDSCCECIGQYCIGYGINESRCGNCPAAEEGAHDEDDLLDDDFDYGEGDDDEFDDVD